ncbi:MAG: hypothetical protein HOD72_03675 [Opitutae bacterium]|jgi:hypothetical protein|nr:hypothetical protein [Opitutae bacterium]MBT4223545.1 hypothetical protein [Opitutae bacterium]MBT5691657.1 hypothetical protein [Opitutae bacterium]MBT6461777.1 hypothetical protein [Opitutae bacterium]MBT7853881.1 hypothetical protein [Opitutae bacterium]
MKPENNPDELIDRYLRDESASPSPGFTEQVISCTRRTSTISRFTKWILPLAACLAFAAVFMDLLKKDSSQPEPPAPVADQFAFDDILLLAEPLDETSPLLDEETLELFALLSE